MGTGSREVARRQPGRPVRREGSGFEGIVGVPIDYVPAEYLCADGWDHVPASAREWATARAGANLTDPVTGAPVHYWFCDITPEDGRGPGGRSAEFELFLFGRRGLAVVRGSTPAFRPGGETRWRQERWDLPVDAAGVRHDHLRQAMPHTGASGDGGPSGAGTATQVDLLPASMRSDFGNLPLATQRFLVEPFASRAKPPQQAVLRALRQTTSGRTTETLWTYLFDARWVAFAQLRRDLPDERARAVLHTPWDVAAWVAPVARPGEGLERR